ncbi:MAG TPA: hypothetical protein VFD55_00530 [Candidatus Angelobacter sp.]|nr:hypothetical protein [Candidatus Angelobacter sp.]
MGNNGANFYEPVKVSGQTEKLVADPNVAQELAEIAKPGIDAALNREQELKEGLTETEKENLQIMEALPEKYPHAFTNETDKDGRPYLIFKGYNFEKDFNQGHLVFCQKGLMHLTDETYKKLLSLTGDKKLISEVEFFDSDSNSASLVSGDYKESTRLFNLRDTDRESLKERFSTYEEAHKNDVEPKEPTTQELIDSL